MSKKYHQIFICGEEKYLHVYIYIKDLNKQSADAILDKYIEKYKDKNFDELQLTFLDTRFAEGYLELINKKSTDKNFYIPMSGTKMLKGNYNYRLTDKKMEDIFCF